MCSQSSTATSVHSSVYESDFFVSVESGSRPFHSAASLGATGIWNSHTDHLVQILCASTTLSQVSSNDSGRTTGIVLDCRDGVSHTVLIFARSAVVLHVILSIPSSWALEMVWNPHIASQARLATFMYRSREGNP